MGIRCKLCCVLRRDEREERGEVRRNLMLLGVLPWERTDYGTGGKC